MKVLFIGKRFYTNKDAWLERFGRIFRLPEDWAKHGHDVRLWLVDYHSRMIVSESAGLLKISSSPVFSLAFARTLLSSLRNRPHIVVASGDCYLGALGLIVARLCRARFVFDIYDKYDEFAGYVKPARFDLFRFLRSRADVRMYSSAPLARHYEADNQDSVIIPNGVDRRAFKPLVRSDCRRLLNLDGTACLVGYFGGMEADRGVQDLVGAVRRLRASGLDVRLVLCGKQHGDTHIAEDWIIFRGMVPHSEIPTYLNACDVLAIPYRLSPFMDMGASCKIAEYLMCERPIVSTRTPNFVANFPDQAAQIAPALCAPGNESDLARALAFQIEEKLVATPPVNFDWQVIAALAISKISQLEEGGTKSSAPA